MSWVRIHDGAMSHPKIVGLIDWRNPFCVWVWGLSYCQQHLTDGRITKAALPNKDAVKTAQRLVSLALWHQDGEYFRVHDYLDWNNSRDVISEKRSQARDRARSSRERAAHVTRTSSLGVLSLGSSEGEPERKPAEPAPPLPDRPAVPAVSRRDRDYGRIFLHGWQQQALVAALGIHAETFDLDVWLDSLSAKANALGVTFPNDKVRWAWVQAQLTEEVHRRGLPVASSTVATAPQRPRNCKHVPPCVDDAAHTAKAAAERKQVPA